MQSGVHQIPSFELGVMQLSLALPHDMAYEDGGAQPDSESALKRWGGKLDSKALPWGPI